MLMKKCFLNLFLCRSVKTFSSSQAHIENHKTKTKIHLNIRHRKSEKSQIEPAINDERAHQNFEDHGIVVEFKRV